MNDFEKLYQQHASQLLRFAWGLSGSKAVAEDLVSETFMRVLVRAPKIRTRTARAYLLTVVRNLYLNNKRQSVSESPLTDHLPASHIDLDLLIDDRARLDLVARQLAELPEGERSALLLRVDHELSYDEIAVALGTTTGAAKVRVHRARLRLARSCQLEDEENHEF